MSAIFEKLSQIFQMTNQLSRKSQDVEGFQFTCAIILFETQAGIKMPRLPILEKKKGSFQRQHLFLQTNQNFDCFENSEAKWKSDTQSW